MFFVFLKKYFYVPNILASNSSKLFIVFNTLTLVFLNALLIVGVPELVIYKVVGILTGRQKEPLLPIDYHNDPANRFARPPKI